MAASGSINSYNLELLSEATPYYDEFVGALIRLSRICRNLEVKLPKNRTSIILLLFLMLVQFLRTNGLCFCGNNLRLDRILP